VAAEIAAPEATTAEPKEDAATKTEVAPEPQRSAAGLPVRTPRATGITEYRDREFEDAPAATPEPATDAQSAPPASATKSGRLSWLPGRAKAAAEAARAEAEANEDRQMPSNLSAWLDHRAKLVEAAKARELGTNGAAADDDVADATSDSTLVSADSAGAELAADPAAEVDRSADVFVATPAEAVSEAGVAAPVDTVDNFDNLDNTTGDAVVEVVEATAEETGPLPTRVPGATATLATPTEAAAVPSSLPRVRAHNTSFFGARRARDVTASQPTVEGEAVDAAPVAEVAEPTEVSDGTEAIEISDGTDGTDVTDVTQVTEVTLELETANGEPAHAEPPQFAPVVAEVTEHTAATEALTEATMEAQPEAPTEEELSEALTEAEAVIDLDRGEAPRTTLNDTRIFRAMMSRWLTDDSGPAPAATSWSTNEADQAWSAAARIEETQPLEESAAGLPKRRPGNYLIPGTIDESDDKPAAPAAPRRDPEAIRRNLNRHQNGVSSARTEAQDGTHREEADVHH
jgi:hypothetical protein